MSRRLQAFSLRVGQEQARGQTNVLYEGENGVRDWGEILSPTSPSCDARSLRAEKPILRKQNRLFAV